MKPVTSTPLAQVVRIDKIEDHPNADRLDLVSFIAIEGYITLVTGKHYAVGERGVWIKPGTKIPGFLAKDFWLSKRGDDWFYISALDMRGIVSPGLFAGEALQNDRTSPWQNWELWQPHWRVGDSVGAFLGVVRNDEIL